MEFFWCCAENLLICWETFLKKCCWVTTMNDGIVDFYASLDNNLIIAGSSFCSEIILRITFLCKLIEFTRLLWINFHQLWIIPCQKFYQNICFGILLILNFDSISTIMRKRWNEKKIFKKLFVIFKNEIQTHTNYNLIIVLKRKIKMSLF